MAVSEIVAQCLQLLPRRDSLCTNITKTSEYKPKRYLVVDINMHLQRKIPNKKSHTVNTQTRMHQIEQKIGIFLVYAVHLLLFVNK